MTDQQHHDRVGPGKAEPSQLNQPNDPGTTVKTPVRARAGFLGKPVALVLITSLVLAVVAGIAVGYIPM